MKLSTLCFLLKDDQILLAMKKRGFGEGKWNGVGGKVNTAAGETVEQCALREMKEEIGVAADEGDLEPMGMLRFRSIFEDALNWDVRIFFLHAWRGEPRESEEVRPQWFPAAHLPFAEMWPDDRHWFPYLLAGKRMEGEFFFNESGDGFIDFSLAELH